MAVDGNNPFAPLSADTHLLQVQLLREVKETFGWPPLGPLSLSLSLVLYWNTNTRGKVGKVWTMLASGLVPCDGRRPEPWQPSDSQPNGETLIRGRREEKKTR